QIETSMQSMFAGDVASPELPSHTALLPECNSEISNVSKCCHKFFQPNLLLKISANVSHGPL
uniref:Uncharacterized protein n=1 Tax=Pavo cristatus TaxID=9049 RepID=A0A8C9FNE3_PAVCR